MKKSRKQKSVYENIISKKEHVYKKGTRPIVGIDIGSRYIKVIQMKKNNKISKLAIEPIPDGVMALGRIEAKEPLIDLLKKIRKNNKITGSDCAICISGNEIIVRELVIPEMDEEQILDNIRHEIASFLPLGYEDYSIDYKVLEYIPEELGLLGKLRVIVAAIPSRQARDYVETLKRAKFKVKYIDVIPNIDSKLARWVMQAIGKEELKDIAIIDFGSNSTHVSVLHQGNYCLHKTISNGGDYLTSIISEKSGMDYNEADVYKLTADFFKMKSDNVLAQHVVNHFDHLILEVDRILEFYRNRNNHKGIDQIYIMGGGSLLMGLPGYLEKRIGVKVFPLAEALEMFRGRRNQTEYLGVLFHAIGATMREEC